MGCGIRNQALIHLQSEGQATGGATKSSSEHVSNISGPGKANGGQGVSKMRPTNTCAREKDMPALKEEVSGSRESSWISSLFQTSSGVIYNYPPKHHCSFTYPLPWSRSRLLFNTTVP